jgi:hypothetical protein
MVLRERCKGRLRVHIEAEALHSGRVTLNGDQFLQLIYLILALVVVAGGYWWRRRP